MNIAIVLTMTALRVGEDKLALNRVVTFVEAPKDEKDNLDFFYKHIDCDTMDGVYFDGYDFFVDDNGLLKSGNVVCEYNGVPLAGNIVVTAGCDSVGKTLWFDSVRDAKRVLVIKDLLETADFMGVVR